MRTWGLQRALGATRRFRALLPLYPLWFVTRWTCATRSSSLSSSVAFRKAVRTGPDAIHVSYVYTPMRYAWDLDAYLDGSSLSRPADGGARPSGRSRRWDRTTAGGPDVIVAISRDRPRAHPRRGAGTPR